jgi:hypothetical protein
MTFQVEASLRRKNTKLFQRCAMAFHCAAQSRLIRVLKDNDNERKLFNHFNAVQLRNGLSNDCAIAHAGCGAMASPFRGEPLPLCSPAPIVHCPPAVLCWGCRRSRRGWSNWSKILARELMRSRGR